MLSINDINLLQAQNEGYRKQNEDLQKENKHLKDLYNQALKDYEQIQGKCEKYKQVLNDINDLVSKWYENDIIQSQGDYDEFLDIINKVKKIG